MRVSTLCCAVAILLMGGCGGGSSSVTHSSENDAIDAGQFANISVAPMLSVVATYSPSIYQLMNLVPSPFVDSYASIRLGTDKRQGIIIGSWSYNVSLQKIAQTNILILDQKVDGTLRKATTEYVSNSLTNGVGSIVVADFNGDGKDDFFLPAYNETPAMPASSVAYISTNTNRFTNLGIVSDKGQELLSNGSDRIIVKDASVIDYNGNKSILVSATNPTGQGYLGLYEFDGIKFRFTKITQAGQDVESQSVASINFFNNQNKQIVFGGHKINSATRTLTLNSIHNNYTTNTTNYLPDPYFNKPLFDNYASNDTLSKTKQPKIWVDDFNQDGWPDLVVASEIYPGWRATLQLLKNNGQNQFTDQTQNMPFNQSSGLDYSMQLIDVDKSGIKTYFAAQTDPYCGTVNCRDWNNHGNYVIVNDGSGQFHTVMHSEFINLGQQVLNLVKNNSLSTDLAPITWQVKDQALPKFIAYQTTNELINFLASVTVLSNMGDPVTFLINVPLQLNLKTQFKKDIIIKDRNNSKNIRTFAGNDTVIGGCQGTCKVDGGLGINTVVYNNSDKGYNIHRTETGFTVIDANGNVDNLFNIKFIKFINATYTN